MIAQALATPNRLCCATRLHLPRFFLQDFSIVSHPETGKPWWVSPSLAPAQQQGLPTAQAGKKLDRNAPASSQGPATRASNNKKVAGPTGYALSRQAFFKEFRKDSRHVYSNAHRRNLLRPSCSSQAFSNVLSTSVWRDDMDTFLLELMRRRIVEGLLYLSGLCEQERKYLVRCKDWEDVQNHKHVGCVLWLSEPVSATEGSSPRPVPPTEHGRTEPGQLATMDVKEGQFDTKLTVHNLKYLLGDEHLEGLRSKSAILSQGSIVLLCRKRTIQLQLRLWKLQGYLAKF